jgi:50S ribosomal protein L16 3-hydroxylase
MHRARLLVALKYAAPRYNAHMSKSAACPIEVHGSARHLLGMSPTQFLRDYWQKQPLLVRQAFAGFKPPVQPDDLAGLACEDGVLARLITHDEKRARWQVRTGPLGEDDFARTGNANWTLLVQDVDKWDADVARLLRHFSFLPTWRVDDIMVSYAEDGGGVGAHIDQYDVFLIQGLGERHWAISTDPTAPRDFRPDVELKQLVQFTPTHEWLLGPGDLLYLPPGVPHDGIAVGAQCMTLSVGMRAPSAAELTGDLADYLAERLPDDRRYADPDLSPATRSGEIDRATLRRLRQSLPFAAAFDDAMLLDWFGRFITRYRNAQVVAAPARPLSTAALAAKLVPGTTLLRHPWTRLAWSHSGSAYMLYASGEAYPAPAKLAQALCAQSSLVLSARPDAASTELLRTLLNAGHLSLQRPRR